MLTGEAWPVAKGPGDEVVGATVNTTGTFLFRATRVGADTALARIVALVEQAQGSKPPIQRLADRISEAFVPAVVILAVAAFLGWWLFGPEPRVTLALTAFIGVVIVACPCAMGLATPTAIMVGTGRGAEAGILFRGGEALGGRRTSRSSLRQDRHADRGPAGGRRRRAAPGVDPAALIDLAASLERRASIRSGRRSSSGRSATSWGSGRSRHSRACPDGASRGASTDRSVLVGSGRLLAERGSNDASTPHAARCASNLARSIVSTSS
jgi:Cu+-exporting ATPase